jgi:hypothetical protein
MYWMPTLTLLASPSAVIESPAERASSSCSALTFTSLRRRSTWLGRSPSTSSNCFIASSTESGCATQVPSKPSPASRDLSARIFSLTCSFCSGSLRLGMNAAMPPIACAPRLWQVLTSSSV